MVLANKAAILFHRAAHLTGQWSPSMLCSYFISSTRVLTPLCSNVPEGQNGL